MNEYRNLVERIYIRQYTIMKYFALWELSPNTSAYLKTLYKIYFIYFFIFWLLSFDYVMIMQVITNIGSIKEIINVLFMLATAIAVLGKYLTVKTKNQAYENFFKLMYDKQYLPQNKEEEKIYKNCIELNKKVRNFYTNISLSACGSLCMTQYLSEDENMPVSVYSPIGLDTKWKYNIIYLYVCLSLSVLCLLNVAFDTLSSSFFIHLKGQLDMLGHRLENIGRHLNDSQDIILLQLKECIRNYNRILALSHYIEYLVSIPISLQIGCSVFVLVANFYAMSLVSGTLYMFTC